MRDQPKHPDPTPTQIERATERIRRRWSEGEWLRRRGYRHVNYEPRQCTLHARVVEGQS